MPRVDVTLEVGSTTDSVTVSAAASLLATETALAGQILEGATVVRIPVQQTAASRMLYYFPTVISSQNYHIDTVGSLGRNIYESPGLVWMQFSLFKSFTIGERFKFTLRGTGTTFPTSTGS